MPSMTANQASWTTSAADSAVETNPRATLSMPGDHASTTRANAASSPAMRPPTSSSSVGMVPPADGNRRRSGGGRTPTQYDRSADEAVLHGEQGRGGPRGGADLGVDVLHVM